MGSGLLLAILVGLWFVVLVPMVVTRGEVSAAPSESRVLRRRSDLRTDRNKAASNTLAEGAESPGAAAMPTEPIPRLPATPGAPLAAARVAPPLKAAPKGSSPSRTPLSPSAPAAARTAVGPSAAAAARTPVRPSASVRTPVGTDSRSTAGADRDETPLLGDIDIRARRRRMLLGLIALAVFWAAFALLWQPVLWWVQVVFDLVVFGYVVFLRLEAQREQDRLERRRARANTRVRLPEDRVERSVRVRTEYQSQVATASRNDHTNSRAIALDDDDPNLAQMPMWDPNHSTVAAMRDERSDWLDREAV